MATPPSKVVRYRCDHADVCGARGVGCPHARKHRMHYFKGQGSCTEKGWECIAYPGGLIKEIIEVQCIPVAEDEKDGGFR
jgi:hypothetical protein